MEELEDIPYIKDCKVIEHINKGWSEDKKFYIKTIDNKELILRISDISKYKKKEKEFHIVRSLEGTNILMSSAVEFGSCNKGMSVYSILTWINGEDAIEKLVTLTKERQYNLGFIAGEYLKQIHSISPPSDVKDWFERYNSKIDNKILSYKSCGINLKYSEILMKYIADIFFRLMLLYISTNQLGAISWAKSFGEKEINTLLKQTETLYEWYHGFSSYIPCWYKNK